MSTKIKNLHRLKQKDIKALQDEIAEQFSEAVVQDLNAVEIGKVQHRELIFIDKKAIFFKQNDQLFFTILGLLMLKPQKRKVVVDMGAVKFITNGADVMAPGIVDADKEIEAENQVWICDETHGKPLAVGIALISGDEMVQQSSGKAVRLVHYIGDQLWTLIRYLESG